MSAKERDIAGVMALFDEPGPLIEATRKVRDKGFSSFDCYTPYPVHGLEKAQGLQRSWLPYVTFGAGLAGAFCGFMLQYWTSAQNWPLNVGGKPFNSWPAFVPVMFEVTVLFAALSTVGAMFAVNGLPNLRRRSYDPSLSNNRFALVIEKPRGLFASKEKFDEASAQQFLQGLGAKEVRTVYSEGWF
jgi:hypothetical protein